jgi:hypothetical protein
MSASRVVLIQLYACMLLVLRYLVLAIANANGDSITELDRIV